MIRLFAIAMCLSVLCSALEPEDLLDNGRYHERYTGKLDKAEAFYKRALNHKSADAATKSEARLGLAVCTARAGKHEEAMKLLQKAYGEQPMFLLKMLNERRPVGKIKRKKVLEAPAVKEMKRKLERIVLKSVEFEKTEITEAFTYLKRESRKLDPKGEGVNFLVIMNPIAPSAVKLPKPEGEGFDLGDDPERDLDLLDLSLEDPLENLAKRDPITVTAHWDTISLGNAVRYLCQQVGFICNIEEHAVVVIEPSALRIDFQLRFLPIDSKAFEKYVKRRELDPKNPKPFFERMGVELSPTGNVSYDPVNNQFIARDTFQALTQLERVIREMQPSPMQISVNACLIEAKVEPQVLKRIRPGDLPRFIQELPTTRRKLISYIQGRTLNGKSLSISQTDQKSDGKGKVVIESSLNGNLSVSGDTLTIEGTLAFAYKETAVTPDGQRSKRPIRAIQIKQSLATWDGEAIVVQTGSPAVQGDKTTFLVLNPVLIEPSGYAIRDDGEPKDGWLKVEDPPPVQEK